MTSHGRDGDAIDALCLGEVLIDFMPVGAVAPAAGIGAAAPDVAIGAFEPAAGGAPANVAAGIARLGLRSAFAGRTGTDGFGRFLVRALAAAGVEVTHLRQVPGTRTPVAFVSLDEAGEREFLFYGEPMAGFGAADLDPAAVEGSRLLHVGSISLIDPTSRDATLDAVETARRRGRTVSFDANLRPALWPDPDSARAAIRRMIGRAAIVKLSDEELAFVSGSAAATEGGRSLWHADLRLLVVTHGRGGCTFLSADASGHVPGFDVPTVDTTGAGDAFMAGLLAGILEDPGFPYTADRLHAACRFANAAGALSTTARGAIPALPDPAAVRGLLDRTRG